jgi:hypothetical protein
MGADRAGAGIAGEVNVTVMAGLVPAIHVFNLAPGCKDVDARDKRGHDDGETLRPE